MSDKPLVHPRIAEVILEAGLVSEDDPMMVLTEISVKPPKKNAGSETIKATPRSLYGMYRVTDKLFVLTYKDGTLALVETASVGFFIEKLTVTQKTLTHRMELTRSDIQEVRWKKRLGVQTVQVTLVTGVRVIIPVSGKIKQMLEDIFNALGFFGE